MVVDSKFQDHYWRPGAPAGEGLFAITDMQAGEKLYCFMNNYNKVHIGKNATIADLDYEYDDNTVMKLYNFAIKSGKSDSRGSKWLIPRKTNQRDLFSRINTSETPNIRRTFPYVQTKYFKLAQFEVLKDIRLMDNGGSPVELTCEYDCHYATRMVLYDNLNASKELQQVSMMYNMYFHIMCILCRYFMYNLCSYYAHHKILPCAPSLS